MPKRHAKISGPVEPPALIFYNTKFNFYNVVLYGVRNNLFYLDEALADRTATVNKVREHLVGKVKEYLSVKDYDSLVTLTGEKPTEENLLKYSQL